MPDPATIATLVGVAVLVIKDTFVWGSKIYRSDCWGVHIEREIDHHPRDSEVPTVIIAEHGEFKPT